MTAMQQNNCYVMGSILLKIYKNNCHHVYATKATRTFF